METIDSNQNKKISELDNNPRNKWEDVVLSENKKMFWRK